MPPFLTVFTAKNCNIIFRQTLCQRQEQKLPVGNSLKVKEFTRKRWDELINEPQRQTRETDNTGNIRQLMNKVEGKKDNNTKSRFNYLKPFFEKHL